MTINYIVKGFDKDFYNFDAVVVPVSEAHNHDKSKQALSNCCWRTLQRYYFSYDDANEIVRELPVREFVEKGIMAVKSEKKGVYFIFVLTSTAECRFSNELTGLSDKRPVYEDYNGCCEKIAECINNLDVKNILIHPMLNWKKFVWEKDSDLLANTLKNNIDRFSHKNIYILVEKISKRSNEFSNAYDRMKKGLITPEECKQTYIKIQMEKSLSYTNKLIRNAEMETVYHPKVIAKQFFEDMDNDSWFFYEYIKRYKGTAVELAKKANISDSTISKIKKHEYKEKLKTVVISLAIALDLTVEDRKRFISSAGFSYPITEHDRFIEQQLRNKRYNDVREFNEDIWAEHPNFIIEVRSSKGGKNKKSDK